MKNRNKNFISLVTYTLFAGYLASPASQASGQEIGAWETSSNNAGAGVVWNANPSIWQTNTSSGFVIPGGNTAGISYPDTNTTTITLQPGAFVTNAAAIYANQLTVSNGAVLGIGSTVSVLHNTATTYDWDIFGGVDLTYGSPAINLTNAAVIAVENGGAITNFSDTTKDYFLNYNATNILFLNGSLYVLTGSGAAGGNATFPQATWSPASTTMYAPSAAGSKFPTGLTNQTFGNFVWNYPLQSASSEPGSKFCNFNAGTFAIYSANNNLVEDVPGPGFTMTVGNLLVTNATFSPGASAGTCIINVSNNFIIDSTATLKNNSGSAIANIVFDGTFPQLLAIYGVNASPANFNWTNSAGSTVDLGANMTNTGPLAGSASFNDNGWLDLEGYVLSNGTNFLGSGIVSNTVGTASLLVGSGLFSGRIVGGTGVIDLTTTSTNNTFTLTGVNTYTGITTINAGILALSGNGSIADTTNITINANAIFNVSGLSSAFTLGANQTLQNNGSTAVINGAAGTGSGTVSLTFTSGIPSLVITNGNLTLSSSTVIDIYNSGAALPAGTYTIITNTSAGSPGSVVGTVPSSVTVSGGQIAAGTSAALQISNGALDLVVSGPPAFKITHITVSGMTLNITAINGTNNGPYVLLGTTNLTPPVTWTPILTNSLNGNGGTTLSTNVVNPNTPVEFYKIQQ